ncbi:MAG: DUF3078 domain-containing protein [Bacteroidota bacterium]
MHRITLLLFVLTLNHGVYAQTELERSLSNNYSFSADSIVFNPDTASAYIENLLDLDNLWNPEGDTFRISLTRLIDHFQEPFDSVSKRLLDFQYDSVMLEEKYLIKHDTLPLKWLNESSFIIDTAALTKEPFIFQERIIEKFVDTTVIMIKDRPAGDADTIDTLSYQQDTLLQMRDTVLQYEYSLSVPRRNAVMVRDTLIQKKDVVLVARDTILEQQIDSLYLKSQGLNIFKLEEDDVVPSLIPAGSGKSWSFLADSGKIVVSDPFRALVAGEDSPFNIVPGRNMPDSLQRAVESLISYTNRRDSILIYLSDIEGKRTPFWLTIGKDELYRYWVKNKNKDSITIWMGNPSKHNISFTLEEDVNLKRMRKQSVDDIPIAQVTPDYSLAKVKPLEEIPVYWNYDFSSSFILNQTFLSNWSKGGENSFSSLLDIEGTAEYTHTESKTKWTNNGRIKFGTIISEEQGFRTNTDMFELNSKYNKVIEDKIDFSSVFYFKTQLARGYNYPNDSVVVSKFLNPGTFTIGAGIEYKPFKKTSLNFSVLSYKNTFITDTSDIDQTIHGITANKKARQEMGGQLVIKNKLSLMEDLNISNSVRLFSNYLEKPQNIDVDWEMNIDKRINWYFRILLNLHLIYDDDVRFPVLDDNEEPVRLPDGSVKKVPKTQFKQFLGLTFSFKF